MRARAVNKTKPKATAVAIKNIGTFAFSFVIARITSHRSRRPETNTSAQIELGADSPGNR
jgi:hypothetical protein